jgi:D-glycerate 3-kinase
MGLHLFDQLSAAGPDQKTLIPRFDKSIDDRAPESHWGMMTGQPDVVLFEGWCILAKPQSEAALAQPMNALERERDADGIWRRYVNDSLAGPYQELFKRLDRLLLLKPPSFDQVRAWRELQETKLREKAPASTRLMSPDEIATFIMHYERVTRHLLAEMPARADWVLDIDATQHITGLRAR